MAYRNFIVSILSLSILCGCAGDPSTARKQPRGKEYSATNPRNAYAGRSGEVDAIPSPVTGEVKISKPYTVMGITYYPLATAKGYAKTGVASWYGPNFHGKKTGNGEIYDQMDRTAAHRILPFNTMVKVENLENGKSTIVRVNDRGPFAKNRIIDLSQKAALEIDMVKKGTARVRLTVVSSGGGSAGASPAPNPGGDGYYVQAGAFSSREKAEEVMESVPGKYRGLASVVERETSGRSLHRIIVGPFPHRAKASKAGRDIRNFTRTPTLITQNP